MNCSGLATRKEHSVKAGFNKGRRVPHPLLAFIQCVMHSSQIPASDWKMGWGYPNSCLQPSCCLDPRFIQRQQHVPGGPGSTEQDKSPEIKLQRYQEMAEECQLWGSIQEANPNRKAQAAAKLMGKGLGKEKTGQEQGWEQETRRPAPRWGGWPVQATRCLWGPGGGHPLLQCCYHCWW